MTNMLKSGDAIRLSHDLRHVASRSTEIQSSAARDDDKLKKYPIQETPDLKVQEALIVKDLLYVLVGLEGNYIRYSKKFDQSFDAISGPNYNITKHLDPSLSDIARRLVKLGKYYHGLTSFAEVYDDEVNGKIVQCFCFEIRTVLKEFLATMQKIEHQFQYNVSYSLRLLEQDLAVEVSSKLEHLYELSTVIHQENRERAAQIENHLSNLLKDIKNDLQQTGAIDLHADSTNSRLLKGGLVLKLIEQRVDMVKGDAYSTQFLTALFDSVSKAYLVMLNDWLHKGEFHDPYDEFIIKSNNSTDRSQYSESYWETKFSFRKEGLIKPLCDREIQSKILITGKYLNILKECGVNVSEITTVPIKVPSLWGGDLHLQVDRAYKRANQLITSLYFEGLNLDSILVSLKRFYMFDNVHNFNHFLTLAVGELKKPADLASEATLLRLFSTAYASETEPHLKGNPQLDSNELIFNLLTLTIERNTVYNYLFEILNVQPIDADEALASSNMSFLKNLLNKTLESERESNHTSSTNSKTDNYAINKLNFDISLPFPLNLIITRSFVTQYQLISRHIMIVKFIDKLLETSWREVNFQKFWRYSYSDNSVNKWMLKARILHSKMRGFMNVLQYYISHDTIEKSWLEFKKFLDHECDATNEHFELENLYLNLQSFVNSVFTNNFLTCQNLIDLINKLFAIVILYCNFLNSLRKTLVLLDENLFNEYESKMNNKVFDVVKNYERVQKLNLVLSNYDENFKEVLTEFNKGLKFHGETEHFVLLQLSEKLELAGLVSI